MKTTLFLLAALLVSGLAVGQHVQNGSSTQVLGIAYSENVGQFPDEVLAFSPFAGGYLFAENDALTFSLYNRPEHGQKNDPLKHHVYRQRFEGAHSWYTHPEDNQKLGWTRNFFLGEDPEFWKGGVEVYRTMNVMGLYEGINLELTSDYGNLKTNFYVLPGADPQQIRWHYEGAEAKLVNGHLEIPTPVGEMQEMKPIAWNLNPNGTKSRIPVKYVDLGDGSFGFELGWYEPQKPLVIDPVLVFSSFSGSTADNWGFTATFDNQAYGYGGGIVAGAGFPVSTGAAQGDHGGGAWDMGLMKWMPDGMDIEYATYLGGSGNEAPSSMVVDQDNRLVVLGASSSTDFPLSDNAVQGQHNGGAGGFNIVDLSGGADMVITRFSPDGTSIDASTYLGGTGADGTNTAFDYNYGDPFRAEVVIDNDNHVVCAGNTSSDDFPTAGNATNTISLGNQDGVVFRLNDDFSALDWGTYFGGLLDDSAVSIEPMADGAIYLVGSTQSVDMVMSEGAVYDAFQGGIDGYVARIENGEITASTFVGTTEYDRALFVEQDTDGNIWITGQTEGSWPLVNNTYTDENAGQYFAKFNPDLTELMLSTTFGFDGIFSPINICQTAFLVDECDRLFVAGWGGALNFGFGDTAGMPVTEDAFQSTTDGSDFYLAAYDENVSSLLYGTFFGSDFLSEHVDGGTSRFSPDGTVYQAVCAGCGGSSDFPVSDGAYAETNGSTNCNLAIFKFDFETNVLINEVTASPSSMGCTPHTVTLTGSTDEDVSHYWEFGTGETSEVAQPEYTYDTPGEYLVTYIGTDPNACVISDTAYLTIYVQAPLDMVPAFEWETEPCQDSALVNFSYSGNYEYDALSWDLGDGTQTSGLAFEHEYEQGGLYTVTVTLTDEVCNRSVEISEDVAVTVEGEELIALIATDPGISGCAPYMTTFSSVGSGSIFEWNFGNGSVSDAPSQEVTYVAPGVFEVELIVSDADMCNIPDTAYQLIEVFEPLNLNPVFAVSAPQCQENPVVTLTYVGSQEYDVLNWDLGDGNTSSETFIVHEYDQPGTYTVSATVTDLFCGGMETYVTEVFIDPEVGIEGMVEWPNVFTPNRDALNSRFQPYIVQESGVRIIPEASQVASIFDVYDVQIFNRWGNIVFESSPNQPFWDGGEMIDGVYYFVAKHRLRCSEVEDTLVDGYIHLMR